MGDPKNSIPNSLYLRRKDCGGDFWNLRCSWKGNEIKYFRFPQAGNPKKAFQKHPAVLVPKPSVSPGAPSCSWGCHTCQSHCCHLLLESASSWQGIHYTSTCCGEPFARVCDLKCSWGSKESGSSDSPNSKRLCKASQGCTCGQKPRCRVFSPTVQWHRSVRVWLESHSKAGSLLSVPKCNTSGKGSTPPWFLVIGHSCWHLPGRPGAFFSRIKYCPA